MKRKMKGCLIVIMAIALVAIFAGCVEKEEVTPSRLTTPPPSQLPTSTPTPILTVTPTALLTPIPTPTSMPSLIQDLKDEDSSVRWKAAEALGCMGDTKAVFPLIRAMKDEDSSVRWKAAEALDKIGWDLKDDTERAYYLVAKKEWAEVVKIGVPALKPLTQALKDEDWRIRREAVVALGMIGDQRAMKPLIDALKDEYEDCQWCAAESLELIGSTRAKHAVDHFLEEKDVDLKYIAENYPDIIERGKSGDDLLLIVALNRCENGRERSYAYDMAEDFLNSGNSKLVDAAKHWGKTHGYHIRGGW
jgi:hypothetical protein